MKKPDKPDKPSRLPVINRTKNKISALGAHFRRDGVAITSVESILPALKIAKEASAAFPPLQSAVGAVVSVLEICKVCLEVDVLCKVLLIIVSIEQKHVANLESISELGKNIGTLSELITSIFPPGSQRDDIGMGIRDALNTFERFVHICYPCGIA